VSGRCGYPGGYGRKVGQPRIVHRDLSVGDARIDLFRSGQACCHQIGIVREDTFCAFREGIDSEQVGFQDIDRESVLREGLDLEVTGQAEAAGLRFSRFVDGTPIHRGASAWRSRTATSSRVGRTAHRDRQERRCRLVHDRPGARCHHTDDGSRYRYRTRSPA
jgi:hypothetical protein